MIPDDLRGLNPDDLRGLNPEDPKQLIKKLNNGASRVSNLLTKLTKLSDESIGFEVDVKHLKNSKKLQDIIKGPAAWFSFLGILEKLKEFSLYLKLSNIIQEYCDGDVTKLIDSIRYEIWKQKSELSPAYISHNCPDANDIEIRLKKDFLEYLLSFLKKIKKEKSSNFKERAEAYLSYVKKFLGFGYMTLGFASTNIIDYLADGIQKVKAFNKPNLLVNLPIQLLPSLAVVVHGSSLLSTIYKIGSDQESFSSNTLKNILTDSCKCAHVSKWW